MRLIHLFAIFLLLIAATSFVFANFVTANLYAHQFRAEPDAPPSRLHPLGTDDLGRDRFTRTLYGTVVSLLLAPGAALLSCLIACLVGGIAGFVGGRLESCLLSITDLFLSLPWLFLLITVRAMMPLNISPMLSVAVTFILLGCLGWAAAARIISADVHSLSQSDFILLARATGCSELSILRCHIIPNLQSLFVTQFWISIPVFILAEANLGMLGLGVAEPLPSWGSLLRELEGYSAVSGHLWQFAPLILFITVIGCFQSVLQKREVLK